MEELGGSRLERRKLGRQLHDETVGSLSVALVWDGWELGGFRLGMWKALFLQAAI